jgi:transcription elongation factor GreA
MSKIPMTKEGYQKLFDDLRRMKGPEMQEVLQNLAEAREKGDISENAEYEVAKEQFENLQKKISDLSDRLANSVILDRDMVKTNFVQILTTVRLENLKTKKEQTYTIVPENETDMKAGKISFSSPIGKGLIGKAVNEVVKIKVPAGELEFKILEITAQ